MRKNSLTLLILLSVALPVYSQNSSQKAGESKFYFGFDGALHSEMYSGQFNESSTLPLSSHGSWMSSGFSFGMKSYYRAIDFLDIFMGAYMRRASLLIGRQGEELKGWTYQGGWTSNPLPHDVYYHANSTVFQLGLKVQQISSWSEYWIGAALNFGAYNLNLGSGDNSTSYSDQTDGTGFGYSLMAGIDFPIKSGGITIFSFGPFIEYGGIFAQNTEIQNYIWQGITYSSSEQMFGLSGLRYGLNLRVPFSM